MDLGLLRTFLQVARLGGIRRAADRLYLTPSAISARIRQLEEAIGTPVFVRGKQGTQLTPAGERLLHHAEEVLSAWNRLSRNVALPEEAGSLLAIGATDSLWHTGLLDILPQLQSAFASLAIRAEAGSTDALLQGLLDGWLDAVLLFEPPHIGGCHAEFVTELPLLLVASEPAMSPADIDAVRFIQVDWGISFDSLQSRVLGRQLAGMSRTSSGSLALQWLLRRGGVALLPEALVRDCLASGRLYPVEGSGEVAVPVHLVRTARDMDATALALLDRLAQQLGDGMHGASSGSTPGPGRID